MRVSCDANFHDTTGTAAIEKRARKNIRGCRDPRERAFFKQPLLFLYSFLPSFLPRCDMRPRGVYFLRLLHAHSIILYSFLHLTPRISLTLASLLHLPRQSLRRSLPQYPVPTPYYTAHASLTTPHIPVRIPLTARYPRLTFSVLLLPFPPV